MVKVFTTTSEVLRDREARKESVGFVPTMGNLHAGHISLLEKALEDQQTVYFSIFVNPKQFGPSEDFAKYPRTLEADIEKIEECARKHPASQILVFAPKDPKEIYPESGTRIIQAGAVARGLEGDIRPSHFDGVTTVVYRLFEIIAPNRAYFGLKDYQQYLVIKQMVRAQELPIEIIGLPIIREASGLALSSRNQYLSAEEKEKALTLSRGLKDVARFLDQKKENIPAALSKISELKRDKNWNYLELRDAETLGADISESSQVALLGVYQLGATRLLDNLQMEIR